MSDPAVMADVIDDEYCYKDFSEAKDLVRNYLNTPQPLRPLVERISAAIVKRHPAIVSALSQAVTQNIITEVAKGSETERLLYRALHNVVFLDALTLAMADDVTFMAKLHEHVLAVRHTILPANASLWKVNNDSAAC